MASFETGSWEPPPLEKLQRMLPQYEITGLIGRGGMGAVYKGRQARLRRDVAIKVLPETFTRREEADELHFAERFEREARAMAALDHPAIVSVHDFGETSAGHLYFVMEYVDGMDILHYIHENGGRLSQEYALFITAHVLDALEYAHSHGIVHRDIKPANVLLNHEGRVKIADFGLAKQYGGRAESPSSGLTMTNLAIGTPDYVAPEALELGKVPDHRADLYAVGVMLYQMLTGALPRGQFKLPGEMRPELDPRLDEIVSRSLQPDPEDRYPMATAFRAAIDPVITAPLSRVEMASPEREIEPPPSPSRKPLYAEIAVAAVIILGGLTAFLMKDGKARAELDSNASLSTVEKPEPKAKDKPFVNSLGMKFVPVPINGGPSDGQTVLFSVWETRVGDFKEFLKGDKNRSWRDRGYPQEDDHPVVSVSWEDAAAFCEWLTEKEQREGIFPETQRYRLPTDHEWSCAVGIGKMEDAEQLPVAKDEVLRDFYPWGKDWPPPKGAGNYYGEENRTNPLPYRKGQKHFGYSDGFHRTAPVGSFDPNKYGLYDLGGNAWEWCEDWSSDEKKERVLRGGCWSSMGLSFTLSSSREFFSPETREYGEGFRCVLAQSAAETARKGPAAKTDSAATPSKEITPATATKDKPFVNSLGMKFVPVPIDGGSTDGKRVLFSVWETRVGDWEVFARGNSNRHWPHPEFPQEDDHPVVSVNWEDAVAFCEWLTEKEQRESKLGKDQRYRLPADHEWSCAMGIGKDEDAELPPAAKDKMLKGVYPWGRYWPPPKGAGNYYGEENRTNPVPFALNQDFFGYNDPFDRTAPVGSFDPNQLGLYDLGGNVWEWCEDWYSGEKKERTLRGCAWSSMGREFLGTSSRQVRPPKERNYGEGFRCVLAQSAEETAPKISTAKAEGAATPSAEITPATATKDESFVNSLGMKFVPVPIDGGPTDGKRVLFSVWETRVKDWEAFARGDSNRHWPHPDFPQEEDHPVVSVSWEDAEAFCEWLTEKEQRESEIGKDQRYRLPIDHEWSCAVGIGEEEDPDLPPSAKDQNLADVFPWGRDWPPPKRAGNYCGEETKKTPVSDPRAKPIEGYEDPFDRTAPVGSFEPNEHGLFDLSGNVWEWCEDWYSSERTSRVRRGGSWSFDYSNFLLSSERFRNEPGNRSSNTGFRCVLSE